MMKKVTSFYDEEPNNVAAHLVEWGGGVKLSLLFFVVYLFN